MKTVSRILAEHVDKLQKPFLRLSEWSATDSVVNCIEEELVPAGITGQTVAVGPCPPVFVHLCTCRGERRARKDARFECEKGEKSGKNELAGKAMWPRVGKRERYGDRDEFCFERGAYR